MSQFQSWADWDSLIQMAKYDVDSFIYAPQKIKNNFKLMLKLVTLNGWVLKYAEWEISYNKDVVITAVAQNGLALQFASSLLRDNKDIVLAAVA